MLFKTTAEIAQYADVLGTISMNSVKRTIVHIEENILMPLLGKELYQSLNETYNTGSLSEEQTDLLDKCRSVIGPYFCYNYAPKAEVKLSDSGAQRIETANAKSAYGNQMVNFRTQFLTEGEAACENLLIFLDENHEKYSEWLESDQFADYKGLFIKTGKEFNKYYTTAQPFRNYHAMRFKMVDVEELNIKPAISDALFDYLKEKDSVEEPEWSDEEITLLKSLKKAIAYFTIAFAIPHINIKIGSNGIVIASDRNTVANADQQVEAPADNSRVSKLMRSCEDSGKEWLEKALKYIADNKEEFTAWVAPPALTLPKSNNDTLTGAFGLV